MSLRKAESYVERKAKFQSRSEKRLEGSVLRSRPVPFAGALRRLPRESL